MKDVQPKRMHGKKCGLRSRYQPVSDRPGPRARNTSAILRPNHQRLTPRAAVAASAASVRGDATRCTHRLPCKVAAVKKYACSRLARVGGDKRAPDRRGHHQVPNHADAEGQTCDRSDSECWPARTRSATSTVARPRLANPGSRSIESWNLVLATRSREFVRDLQCDIPMPAPPPLPQVRVHTVCDKLKKR